MTDKQVRMVPEEMVFAFQGWYLKHTGNRIFARNATKAIQTVLDAAPSVQPDREVIERLTKFANSLTGEFSSVVIPAKVAKQAAEDIRSALTVQKEEG